MNGLTTRLADLCRDTGYRLELLFQVVLRLPELVRRRRLIADQMAASALGVLHVVLLVGLFMGMIVSLQTGIELAKIGQQDNIGTIVALSMTREMGPFVTATILAATVGSSIAAELGTMAVSDELAALEVLSIDRIRLLVMPRVVSLAVIAPTLTIVADAIGIFGGGFVAYAQLNVGPVLYLDSVLDALRTVGTTIPLPKDVYSGLFKSIVFGVIIATISCAQGLQARGGALGVGHATRGAVRDSIIAIIVSNYFMTWIMYQD